jgi:SH3 domain protein
MWLSLPASAETVYVTDSLRLGLHRAADTSDRPFRTLESGTELNILERSRNYAKVRVADGTEGYVKAAYLVTEKPARLIVQQTVAEKDALAAELAQMKAEMADPLAQIESLQGRLAERRAAADEAETMINDLVARNEQLEKRSAMYKYNLPWQWVAGTSVVCLLAGFLLALWLTDHRSRKRHGGFRIY